jgi:hypothetical protein
MKTAKCNILGINLKKGAGEKKEKHFFLQNWNKNFWKGEKVKKADEIINQIKNRRREEDVNNLKADSKMLNSQNENLMRFKHKT